MTELDQSGVETSHADDVDLSEIDPRRWLEIRRRIALLCEYEAIDEPTGDTTARFARRMGVGLSSFYGLAKIWRETGDASKLHGARRGQRDRAFNARRNVPQEAIAIVDKTIEDIGIWGRDRAVYEEVCRRVAAADMAPVSTETVRNMILKARSTSSLPSDVKPAILIERCVLKLPLACGGVPVLPQAILAVAVPENVIVGWRIGTDDEPASIAELVDAVAALGELGAPDRPLSGPRLSPGDLAQINLPIDRTSRRMRLRMALGADIGGLAFVTQTTRAVAAAALVNNRLDSPMSAEDVRVAVETAVARHNDGKTSLPSFAIASELPARPYGA